MLDAELEPVTDLEPNLIRDEVLRILLAGYGTAALTLLFATGFVSPRPELAAALREEPVEVSGGDQLGGSHLRSWTSPSE